MFKDKILLITGGTGSFGNAVLERFIIGLLLKMFIFRLQLMMLEELLVLPSISGIKL